MNTKNNQNIIKKLLKSKSTDFEIIEINIY